MAFCSKCGLKLEEGDLFCPKCGAKARILEETAGQEPSKAPVEEVKELIDLKQNLADFTTELLERSNINKEYWVINTGDVANGISFNIAQKGNEEGVRIILSHEDSGEHYFQIHLDYEDTHEAYKHMKWRFGGRQNKWCWWKYLDDSAKNLADLEAMKNRKWDQLLANMSKQLQALLLYVETFERIRHEIYQPSPKDKAEVWIYYELCAAFDYDKTLREDKLFMDVELKENSYTIRFGNRDQDITKLLARLNAIGFNVSEADLQGGRYAAYTGITAAEAVARIKEINSRIS